MAKRRYFTKAVAPPKPIKYEYSQAWNGKTIGGWLPNGNYRVYDAKWLRRMLICSKAGKTAHATGRTKKQQFSSETARQAVRKRWNGTSRTPGRNRLVRGIRSGLTKPTKKLNYAELRLRYAIPRDGWRVRYDTGSKQWWGRDDLGERRCSERVALRYAGHLSRRSMFARLPKQFTGIDLKAEGWNRD